MLIRQFLDFLKEYKIIGLAVAFIMGLAANQLVQSLVNNIIMPILGFFIPEGKWESFIVNVGPIAIRIGQFISDLIYFIIIAFSIFLIAKFILKEEKVIKK